jgi:hypothetical protein
MALLPGWFLPKSRAAFEELGCVIEIEENKALTRERLSCLTSASTAFEWIFA